MGFFSSIGGILGGIGGAFLGGPVGAVIGSGLGGSVGGAVDANSANKQAQGYYNQQMSFAQQQAQFQQDYVKSAIQWRVEDAKKAGIHPLAALGVSNPSYSPVSAPSAPVIQDSSAFDTGSEFGQNLNRASFQAKTQAQQLQSAQLGMEQIELQNRGLSLDNDFKMLQIQQLASQLQNAAASSAPAPKVNQAQDSQLPSGSDAFSVRHIRDNDYDINFNQEYQGELGDEAGQLYNMLRKATRENAAVWTDPKSGVAYVFNRSTGWWNRLSALSPEEAERLLGKSAPSVSGNMPLSSSHAVRNRYRYRY